MLKARFQRKDNFIVCEIPIGKLKEGEWHQISSKLDICTNEEQLKQVEKELFELYGEDVDKEFEGCSSVLWEDICRTKKT